MPLYFLSVGSNIEPEQNVPKILAHLLAISGQLNVSRIIETEPVDIASPNKFFNLCVSLQSSLATVDLKQRLNEIEVDLGRDRTHPDRQRLNRPADIDILFSLTPQQKVIDPALLPKEPFILPLLLELINALGFECPVKPLALGQGVEIKVENRLIGTQPTTIEENMHRNRI